MKNSAESKPSALRNYAEASYPLLSIRNITIEFPKKNGNNFSPIRNLDLTIKKGEAHGLVGESGSGKTVTAMAILGLITPPGRVTLGEIIWKGKNLLTMSEPELNDVRGGGIAMVFQNAPSSLNPALRVETQLSRLLRFRRKLCKNKARQECLNLLSKVKLEDPDRTLRSYPHELSGGMAQRVALAHALACEPELLIADEPTSSVDVTVATQLLELFKELQEKSGLSILLITHDLGAVLRFCNRVSVIYSGKIVDGGTTADVFNSPKHRYTKTLLKSVVLSEP